ncbi:MAG: cob(I)yrinic acid a,c-diamide adenosyltransferase [Chloroflexota bacterium]
MSKTKSPWFTAAGDDGATGLLGARRVPKYHPQPEAFGTVDEATSAMGLARALAADPETRQALLEAQRHLYQMMAELAAEPAAQPQFRAIGREQVAWLETTTEAIGGRMALPREFVIPGDSPAAAALDLARAIVRRAERQVVKLLDDGYVENREITRYLNRLSSLLFALARWQDALVGRGSVTLAKTP